MGKYFNFISGMFRAAANYAKEEIELNKIHKYDKLPFTEVYRDLHDHYDPCFVLSTGRAGTMLMTEMLKDHPEIKVFHEPFPEITYYSEYAYHFRDRQEITKAVIDALRYEHIRNTALLGKKYLETNNRITFFAKELSELYPHSKFIHLHRDPVKFVESGLGRNWYSGMKLYDEGRIRPRPGSDIPWEKYSQVQKIAWLWKETNQFIEEFKATIPPERIMTFGAEEFFRDPVISVAWMKFIGISPYPENKLMGMIGKPVNKQKASKIRKLNKEEIAQVKAMTGY